MSQELDEDGKVLWNLGPLVLKISLEMSSLLTLGLPKRRPRRSVQGRNLKKLGMSANHIIYYT